MPSHTLSRFRPPKALLAIVFLVSLALACGSFAPHPGAEPTPWPTPTLAPPTATPTPPPQQKPATAVAVNAASVQTPTPTVAPSPTPPGNVVVGQKARIVARTGLNIRQEPSTDAARSGRYGAGVLVTVTGGPIYADGFVWWQVDDGAGQAGWVAAGDQSDLWVNGDIGEPRPVNRPVRLGDVVSVSVRPGLALAIRYEPGQSALTARHVTRGTLLDVIGGPVTSDGYRWWHVSRADGLTGWAAEADAETRWLSPLE